MACEINGCEVQSVRLSSPIGDRIELVVGTENGDVALVVQFRPDTVNGLINDLLQRRDEASKNMEHVDG